VGNELKKSTYYDAGEVCIQNTSILIIPSMYLEEMRSEVVQHRFVVISALAKGSDARIYEKTGFRSNQMRHTISGLLAPYPTSILEDQFCLT
jgi:hypothetical protein